MQFTHDPQPPAHSTSITDFFDAYGVFDTDVTISYTKGGRINAGTIQLAQTNSGTSGTSMCWQNISPEHARAIACRLIDAAHQADTLAAQAAAATEQGGA